MPAQVDGNTAEILFVAAQRAHLLGAQAEVLWGTPVAVVPTQEAALHGSVAEALVTATDRLILLGAQTEALWLDLTFLMNLTGAQAEVLWGTPVAVVPTQEAAQHGSAAEVLHTASDEFHVRGSQAEMMVTYDAAVAAVGDISGPSTTLATFDGTTSIGWITSYKWNWVSVPVGSLIGNAAVPYPDFGGTSPIDMTSNAVLYHAEETVGVTGTDTSGSANDAALTAITVGVVGQVGAYSWGFALATSVATPTVPIPTGSSWSIAFWFFDLAPNTLWRAGTRGTSEYHVIVEQNSNRLGVHTGGSFRDSGFLMPSASYTGWHHMVSVGTAGGDTKLYVDGVLAGTVTGYRTTQPIVTIGNYFAGNLKFADRIDEFAVWNRALTAEEISSVFALQSGNFAGFGPTFTFLPDEDGTYTVNLTVVGGLDGVQTVDTADAVIGGGGAIQFPLQGDQIRMWGHLQGQHLRKRGQK